MYCWPVRDSGHRYRRRRRRRRLPAAAQGNAHDM